jgi:hypothetical protein
LSKSKILKYCFRLLLITSLILNYYLYKERENFIIQIGSANQATVRLTLNELGEGNTDYWIEALNEQNGNVRLERHIGELNKLSQEFHKMSGEMSQIGMLLGETINQYYELEDSISKGENIEEHIIAINNRIQFINTILTKIDTDLGEDEKVWYKELSGYETATQKYVWEKFKEYESQNN